MAEGNSRTSESIFLSLLTVLFIGLKLTGHITWSWWWVLAPVWIPAAIVLVILLVGGVIAFVGWRAAR